jgi:glutathione S-transferase
MTMALTLLIGNKNYSSWSLRPWIAMRVAGIEFEETVIPLYEPGSRERVLPISPTGKVPALVHGSVQIWESIAILEYLAERFPHAGLWPADARARAHARAIAAEMHAGFAALRRYYPMNMRRVPKPRETIEEVEREVRRIDALWTDCRERFGAGGPFLFGRFGAADAMYAPVVSRFHTYAVEVGEPASRYVAAVMALPVWAEWEGAAKQEPWVLPANEIS